MDADTRAQLSGRPSWISDKEAMEWELPGRRQGPMRQIIALTNQRWEKERKKAKDNKKRNFN